ncbi:MAG: hypothetical protein IJI77_03180 [Erysipelotrichaceae bacterium]|nr:hypothetical protein [Erysipelotrichaceae bacterium]
MAKKEKRNSPWKEAYENFSESKEKNVKTTGLDKKAASAIVTSGMNISNISILKGSNWLLVADVWFLFALCCLRYRERNVAIEKELLMLDIIATCWALFEIIRKAIKIYTDYSENVPEAVHLFTERMYAENCFSLGYTKEPIYLKTKEEESAKTEEIKRKLRTDIFRKIIIVTAILLVGSFCLLGYIRYWNVKNALLFGLLGIPASLIIAFVVVFAEKRLG